MTAWLVGLMVAGVATALHLGLLRVRLRLLSTSTFFTLLSGPFAVVLTAATIVSATLVDGALTFGVVGFFVIHRLTVARLAHEVQHG